MQRRYLQVNMQLSSGDTYHEVAKILDGNNGRVHMDFMVVALQKRFNFNPTEVVNESQFFEGKQPPRWRYYPVTRLGFVCAQGYLER